MKLSKELNVRDVQKQFNTAFPHLKIEFYKGAHSVGEGSSFKDQMKASVLLGTLNPELEEATVELDPKMKVSEFEDLFEQKFKLHIQVFRLSGSLWLQTSKTDSWTLETQEGKASRSEKFVD